MLLACTIIKWREDTRENKRKRAKILIMTSTQLAKDNVRMVKCNKNSFIRRFSKFKMHFFS